MSTNRSVLILLALCITLFPDYLLASTIYVNKNGLADATSIHNGLYCANPGDTVLVAPGEYTEAHFYLNYSIHLISEEGPEQTIIRHRGSPADMHPNAFFIYADNVTVSGFTITWGHSDHSYLDFDSGGAFWLRGTNILIQNNILTENECSYGGAIYVSGAIVTISDNLIYANNAAIGGAIHILHGTVIIENNTIADNYVTIRASGIRTLASCTAIIRHNIFYNSINDSGCSNIIDYATSTGSLTFECNNVWSISSEAPMYSGLLSDQTGINGNISMDPLLCGESGSGNYYLQAISPCSALNVPEYCLGVRMGKYPIGCETSTETTSWGNIKLFDR